MIRIYLVRHGIALDHADRGVLNDDDRPLSGCEAGTIIYVFATGDVTVCPYLVFAARTPQSRHDDTEFIVGNMFETLSRRSQSLVEQQLSLIEDLERDEDDSDRLQSLFRLDHLATRMRRNGDNLLVLAGTALRRGMLQD